MDEAIEVRQAFTAPHLTIRPKVGRPKCSHEVYGMTCAEADELWTHAQGCCEICGIAHASSPGGLYVDHDAYRGYNAIRGLLCNICNRRLDDPRMWPWLAEYAYNAAHYLLNQWCDRPGAPKIYRRRPRGWDFTFATTFRDRRQRVHQIYRWRHGSNIAFCGVEVFTPYRPEEVGGMRRCSECVQGREEFDLVVELEGQRISARVAAEMAKAADEAAFHSIDLKDPA